MKTRQENGEINPIRDRYELNLAEEKLWRAISPVLAYAVVIQVMAVACGGRHLAGFSHARRIARPA
ncbi:MAG: gamma-glutamyl-gamma-aminobutyrate hydrolase family protein [Clostridia bacterium]